MGLVLDSTVCISAERRGISAIEIFLGLPMELRAEEVAFSVITIAELAVGLARAESAKQREMRFRFLHGIEQVFAAIPVTNAIAVRAGLLRGNLQMRGLTIELADLLIAATALELNYEVVTANVLHFRRVPGLRVVEL